MTVIAYLPENTFGSRGLIAIPCIVCHITQLFMDAPLAARACAARADARAVADAPSKPLTTV